MPVSPGAGHRPRGRHSRRIRGRRPVASISCTRLAGFRIPGRTFRYPRTAPVPHPCGLEQSHDWQDRQLLIGGVTCSWGTLSSGAEQPALWPLDVRDDDGYLVAGPEDLCRTGRRLAVDVHEGHQSLYAVGDLDEDAGGDQFGDRSVQFLATTVRSANARKGSDCMPRKDSLASALKVSN